MARGGLTTDGTCAAAGLRARHIAIDASKRMVDSPGLMLNRVLSPGLMLRRREAPSRSTASRVLPDLRTQCCRSRVNPRSVAAPTLRDASLRDAPQGEGGSQ